MCGRYVLKQVREAEEYFRAHPSPWRQSFNIAPTQQVACVRVEDGERCAVNLRWGLIPFFCNGMPPKASIINARIETVETAPSYRGPWARGQRCIQVASGFYEWHYDEHGRKVPYYIHALDQPVFGFAALWDRSRRDDGGVIESVVHVTVPGNTLLREIHNGGANPYRMPAILRAQDVEPWLTGSVDDARALLRQYDQSLMTAYPVSPRVNSPKNDDPRLLERCDPDARLIG